MIEAWAMPTQIRIPNIAMPDANRRLKLRRFVKVFRSSLSIKSSEAATEARPYNLALA